MLKRYGEKALDESAVRADELALAGDDTGAATWRRIMSAVTELANRPRPAGSTSGQSLAGDRRTRRLPDGACAPDCRPSRPRPGTDTFDPGRVKTAGREVSNDRGVSAVPIAEVGMFQPLW